MPGANNNIIRSFKSVTDTAIEDGRCFCFEADRMRQIGLISPDDPRLHHGATGALQSVPVTKHDFDRVWSNLLSKDHPRAAMSALLVAKHFAKDAPAGKIPFRDVAVSLERAALRVHDAGAPAGVVGSYVEFATMFCDAEVLRMRHLGENNLVSTIVQQSRLPPQRVLAGMLRTGAVDYDHPMVSAFVDGSLASMNRMDRNSFLKTSAPILRAGLEDVKLAKPSGKELAQVEKSVLRLQSARSGKVTQVVREADILDASSALAENLSRALAQTNPGQAKHLAALSMSCGARGQSIRDDHPDQFLEIPRKDPRESQR